MAETVTKPQDEAVVKFEELKSKIVAGIAIDPALSYVFLIRKGTMTETDKSLALDFWRRHFKTPCLFLTVANPEKDILALEIVKPEDAK